jgi:hypothetical protein
LPISLLLQNSNYLFELFIEEKLSENINIVRRKIEKSRVNLKVRPFFGI